MIKNSMSPQTHTESKKSMIAAATPTKGDYRNEKEARQLCVKQGYEPHSLPYVPFQEP